MENLKYTLIDNGADSLKSAYENLELFDNVAHGGHHRLKDSVIFLNHGIEILFKLILKNHSPSLMFEKTSQYMKAKEKLRNSSTAKNVFDIDKSLRTITLLEALNRVELLCDIDIPKALKGSILYVNDIRNKIMHYTVELDVNETEDLVRKLKFCYEEAVKFLEKHIADLKSIIQDSRFELTCEEHEEQQAEMYGEMYYEMQKEDAFIDHIEGAYEDLGEGKW